MKFKCKLKVIFAELDIKQSDFAKRIGVDDSTLSAIVRNRTKPRFDTAYLICKELGKPIEEISPSRINSSPSSLNKSLSLFFFLHLTFAFDRQSWDEGTGQRLGQRMTTLQRFKIKAS